MGQQSLVIAAVFLLILFSSLLTFFKQNTPSFSWKIVVTLACLSFNIYVFDLLNRNATDTILQILTVTFIALHFVSHTKIWSFFLIGFTVAINPSNLMYAFAGILFRNNGKMAKIVLAGVGLLFGFLYMDFHQAQPLNYYKNLYFPLVFEPQFNLLWILYSHMFESYLQLYQIMFIFLQIGSLYLVANLNLTYSLRLLILTYFKVYCSYSCSNLSMLTTLIIYVLLLTVYLPKTIQKWSQMNASKEITTLKTLTLVTVIANMAFYPLSHLLLERYLNDFSINVGYIFLFFGFPWAFNSVYFSELLINRIEIVNKNQSLQAKEQLQKEPPLKYQAASQ